MDLVPEEATAKRSERVASLRTNLAHGDATDERLARLPAWARLYIAELEAMALRSSGRASVLRGEGDPK